MNIYIISNILLWVFVAFFLIDMLFKPTIDRTKEGDILLWYTSPKTKQRTYKKIM